MPKHCSAIFKVDKKTHLINRGFVNEMKEFGGNLTFDMKNKTLYRGDLGTGHYNGIHLSRGIVDFHTHPAKCLNNNKCALSLPSPADLKNIVIGALFGTSAHLIYGKEGTFLVQVKASKLRKIQNNNDEISKFVKKIDSVFEKLHSRFIKNKNMPYRKYITDWIVLARKNGFIIRLFKKNAVPRIRIYFDCHLYEQKQKFIPRVEIPLKMSKYTQ
jgi:hypothetical protein